LKHHRQKIECSFERLTGTTGWPPINCGPARISFAPWVGLVKSLLPQSQAPWLIDLRSVVRTLCQSVRLICRMMLGCRIGRLGLIGPLFVGLQGPRGCSIGCIVNIGSDLLINVNNDCSCRHTYPWIYYPDWSRCHRGKKCRKDGCFGNHNKGSGASQ
jgi:hypothetical protein